MTNERIAAIRTREQAATPGPWKKGFKIPHGYTIAMPAIKDYAEVLVSEEDAEFIADARQYIPELLDALEEEGYRFYYCESEDSYLLGRRVDNLYYAHWHEGLGFVWDMSRYLPWGKTIEDPTTEWKVHTYPSEPVEIGPSEWFLGFLKQRFVQEGSAED